MIARRPRTPEPRPRWLRPVVFDTHRACHGCPAPRVGVRAINPTLAVLAEHSVGRGRIVEGEPRCAAAASNVAGAA